MISFLQEFRWFRVLTLWVTETLGTYLSRSVGDWCAYHFGIVHALLDVSEERRDWESYRNVRDWIARFEKRAKE
jgi:hypothetical protein